MAKLLIFDDDMTCRTQLEDCFRSRHQATFVETVDAVIELLEREPFDAVVANVAQQNENVLGLLQRAKTSFLLQKVPFICFRGPDAESLSEMDDTLSMGMQMLGARAYIAADNYQAVAPQIEKVLKQNRPKTSARSRR